MVQSGKPSKRRWWGGVKSWEGLPYWTGTMATPTSTPPDHQETRSSSVSANICLFIIQWISHFFLWDEFRFHILRRLLHLTRFVSSVSVLIVLLVQRQYDISRVRTVFRHHGRVGLCKHTHTMHCVRIVSSSWTAGLSAVLPQHTNPITPYPPPTAASLTDFSPFSFFSFHFISSLDVPANRPVSDQPAAQSASARLIIFKEAQLRGCGLTVTFTLVGQLIHPTMVHLWHQRGLYVFIDR